LPFAFIDHVARLVCSDFFHVNAGAFEDVDHLPDAGDVLGGASLESADTQAKLVASEGGTKFRQFPVTSSVGSHPLKPQGLVRHPGVGCRYDYECVPGSGLSSFGH
jgi:hypothetical protein